MITVITLSYFDSNYVNSGTYSYTSSDGVSLFTAGPTVGYVNMKFKVKTLIKLTYGNSATTTSDDILIIIYKNNVEIDSASMSERKKDIYINVEINDEIKVHEGLSGFILYKLEIMDSYFNTLQLTMGDSISLSMKNNDVVKTINIPSSITSDKFYHIVGTVDNENNLLEMYVDGELAGSTSVTPFDANTTFTYNYLGTNVSKDNWFNGTIGYFKVWDNYELTNENIEYLSIVVFNKVRVFRSDPTTSGEYNLEIAEFQIWINGTNVAPNITPTNYIERTDGGYGITYINNENTGVYNTGDVYIATDSTQQSPWVDGTKNLTDDPIEVIFNMNETVIFFEKKNTHS